MPRRAPKGIELGTAGCLGPEYTFTHIAARNFASRYNPDLTDPDNSLSMMNSNLQIIKAVADGEVSSGVVPYQNIVGGRPSDVVDGVYRYARSHGVRVVDSINTPIRMCIGGICNSSDVKNIVSKDVAMYQCSEYLTGHHPRAEWISVKSTVKGIQLIADGKYEHAAGLGAREAFERFKEHGMTIYTEDMGNIKPNMTRFLLIKGRGTSCKKSRKGTMEVTTVAVTPKRAYKNLPHDLSDLAGDCGVVVKYSYSRPAGADNEIVFLDLVGFRSDKNVEKFLSGLSKDGFGRRTEYIVIGSYPFDEFFEPRIKTIGVIGGQQSMNNMLGDFYNRCGYNTIIDGGETTTKSLTRRSDIVVINRVGKEGTINIIGEIGEYLDGEKLLVINSSNPDHVKQVFSDLQIASELLYMDAPVVKRVPVKGQNVIFIGDINFTPGSIQSEFVGIYDDRDANVTFTDFKTHATYRNFSTQASTLSAIFYLKLARECGIDFRELRNFTSATEAIFTDAAQKLLTADRRVRANSLHRYLQTHGKTVKQVAGEICNTPDLSVEQIELVLGKAVKSSTGIDDATKRITALYQYMFGTEDF